MTWFKLSVIVEDSTIVLVDVAGTIVSVIKGVVVKYWVIFRVVVVDLCEVGTTLMDFLPTLVLQMDLVLGRRVSVASKPRGRRKLINNWKSFIVRCDCVVLGVEREVCFECCLIAVKVREFEDINIDFKTSALTANPVQYPEPYHIVRNY